MPEAEPTPTVLPPPSTEGVEPGLVPEALLGREKVVASLLEDLGGGGLRCWHLAPTDVLHQLEFMEALALGLGGLPLWGARAGGELSWGEPLRAWLGRARRVPSEPGMPVDGLLFDLRGHGKEGLFAALDAAVAAALAEGPLVLGLADAARCDPLTLEWLRRVSTAGHRGSLLLLLGGVGLKGRVPAAGVLHEGPWSPALAAELATRMAGGGSGSQVDDAWIGASTGRLALRRWVTQRLRGVPPRPDDGVRELGRAVAMVGGWVLPAELADLMDMPVEAFDEMLARALGGGWLLPVAGGLGLTSEAEVDAVLADLSPPNMTRWQRRLAAVAARPPLLRLQAAVAGGVEGLTVPLGLQAARELLPLGGAEAWLAVVCDALAVPDLAELGTERLRMGVAVLGLALGRPVSVVPDGLPEVSWLAARVARLAGRLEEGRTHLVQRSPVPGVALLEERELALIDEADGRPEEARRRLDALAAAATLPAGEDGVCLQALIEADVVRLRLAPDVSFARQAGEDALACCERLRALGQDKEADRMLGVLGAWAIRHERWGLADQALGASAASLEHVWALLRAGSYQRALLRLEDLPLGGDLEAVCGALAAVCQLALGLAGDPLGRIEAAAAVVEALGDEAWGLRLGCVALEVALHLGRFRELAAEPVAAPTLVPAWGRLVRAEAALRLGEPALAERWLQLGDGRDEGGRAPATGVRSCLVRAGLARARGDRAGALAWLAEAAALVGELGAPAWEAEVALRRGEHHLASADDAAALVAFAEALRLAELVGGPLVRALAFGGLARASVEASARASFAAEAESLLRVLLAPLSDAERADFLGWRERAEALRIARPEPPESASAWEPVPSFAEAGARLLGLLAGTPEPEVVGEQICESLLRVWPGLRAGVYTDVVGRSLLAFRGEAVFEGGTWMAEALFDEVVAAGVPDGVLVCEVGEGVLEPEALTRPARGWRLVLLPLPTSGWGEVALAAVEVPKGEALDPEGLEAFCQHAGLVLARAHRDAEAARQVARSNLFTRLHHALAGTLDVDALLRQALHQVLAIFQGEQAFVFFGADQACRASLDRVGGHPDPSLTSRTVRSRVMAERRPVTILDVGQDHDAVTSQSLMLRNVRSVMCVPLMLADDLLGVLYVSSSTAIKTFTRLDLDVLGAIASHLALLLQNAQAFETIRELNQGLEAKVQARTQELEAAMLALRDTQAQLLETEKLATVGTLAAGVAHEINNPLGAVLVNAQLLKQDPCTADQLESVELIERGAKRCQEIVRALLAYARPVQVERHAVDLERLAADTMATLAGQPRLSGLNIGLDMRPVPLVMGDVGELRHLLSQLVLNAADAVEGLAEVPGAIQVRVLESEDGVVLEVADNGVGMTPEVARRVFDPFFTTKAVGAGKGLGLSLCRRIVEKHGGTIAVTSEAGRGATVRVLLPKG
ncbi:MAG: GAF domain-containing sensor histidine kinase [Candidatus Sericytochromatia bacterium]|nr:GAF domain-containing sensor histidine kinase [Candidatus Sericytochromatia bacterium]